MFKTKKNIRDQIVTKNNWDEIVITIKFQV